MIMNTKHLFNALFTSSVYCPFLFYFFLEKRQTILFSATQTRNVEDLARISLKKSPIYVGVDDHKDTSTVEGLEQVIGGTCC